MPSSQPTSTPTRHAVLVARAIAYIDTHLDERLDAITLADQAAMSRFHFHRVFQALMGCSLGEYVGRRRLQRAAALLVGGRMSVLDIALSVGYESAQSLAKVTRRELGLTPTALRRTDPVSWTRLFDPAYAPRLSLPPTRGNSMIQPTRYVSLPAGLVALTATARGMVDGSMTLSASQAFTELGQALGGSGHFAQVRSWMCFCPDDPQSPDDPDCRYVAGAVFGYAMHDGSGRGAQPDIALSGSLAWQALSAGPHVVFEHIGPYTSLHLIWQAIYRDWLPASGQRLRDAAPMELMWNDPEVTPPELLKTEIWLPLA